MSRSGFWRAGRLGTRRQDRANRFYCYGQAQVLQVGQALLTRGSSKSYLQDVSGSSVKYTVPCASPRDWQYGRR